MKKSRRSGRVKDLHLPNDSHGERGGKGPHRPPGNHQEALRGCGHGECQEDEGRSPGDLTEGYAC